MSFKEKKGKECELQPVLFVRPKTQAPASIHDKGSEASRVKSTNVTDGTEVRSFYETVIGLGAKSPHHHQVHCDSNKQTGKVLKRKIKQACPRQRKFENPEALAQSSVVPIAVPADMSAQFQPRLLMDSEHCSPLHVKGQTAKMARTFESAKPIIELVSTNPDSSVILTASPDTDYFNHLEQPQSGVQLAGAQSLSGLLDLTTGPIVEQYNQSPIQSNVADMGKVTVCRLHDDESMDPVSSQRNTKSESFSAGKCCQNKCESVSKSLKNNTKTQGIPKLTKKNNIRMINGLLKTAQEGHVAAVKRYLEAGVKVNARDSFGWTALMCAAHCGNRRMVTFLLEQGADANQADSTGKTALDIARLSKHHKLAKLLLYGHVQHEKRYSEKKPDPFYCEICKTAFNDISRKKHETSTVHLFNMKSGTGLRQTNYLLPECNKGYQLMVKSGWNREKGLGPEGKGQKFPVKTILKRDRQGLGLSTGKKPRITHFEPKDDAAVKRPELNRKMKPVTLRKIKQAHNAKKDQEFEKNFRLEFLME